jgi:GTP cyclohydrolase IA
MGKRRSNHSSDGGRQETGTSPLQLPFIPEGDAWRASYFDGVRSLLKAIGEDPDRAGLRETPARVWRAMREMTKGYWENPVEILRTTFDETCNEMVVVRGIDFTSLCEHHLLPFVGSAVVGYLPNGHVVGLSKIPRLVDCFARRLQVQERMTIQIATAMMECLNPLGVGVILTAKHACTGCRGVRKANAEMITSSLLGAFREDERTRSEFLNLGRG